MNLTKAELCQCFDSAVETKAKYVAVSVRMEAMPENEIIINKYENISKKIAYYYNVYDDNLNHKYSPGISIVGCTFGNSLEEIEKALI